jgi:hypothetical protein
MDTSGIGYRYRLHVQAIVMHYRYRLQIWTLQVQATGIGCMYRR